MHAAIVTVAVLLVSILVLPESSPAPPQEPTFPGPSTVFAHHDAEDPVPMSVDLLGSATAGWTLISTGSVQWPAPAATLELSAVGLVPTPGESWVHVLSLEAGDTFYQEFDIAPSAVGGTLVLTFEYDSAPSYRLYHALNMTITVNPLGSTSFGFEEGAFAQWETYDHPAEPLGADPGGTIDGPTEYLGGDGDEIPHGFNSDSSSLMSYTTTLAGTITVSKYGGGSMVCRYCKIAIFDFDQFSAPDHLDWAITNYAGYFIAPGIDNSDGQSAGIDPYFRIYFSSDAARAIRADGTVYTQETGVAAVDCPSEQTCTTNAHGPLDYTEVRAAWAYNSAVASWRHVYGRSGTSTDIDQVKVRLPADNYHTHLSNAHYHPDTGEIHLRTSHTSPWTHAHEYGHHAMKKMYGGGYPGNDCEGHEMMKKLSHGCAWKEGWANAFSVIANNNPKYTFPSGSYFNLESRTSSGSGTWEQGDEVEGNVAASMWDLYDSYSEGGLETADYDFSHIWAAFKKAMPDTSYSDYRQSWLAVPLSEAAFDQTANANTIPY